MPLNGVIIRVTWQFPEVSHFHMSNLTSPTFTPKKTLIHKGTTALLYERNTLSISSAIHRTIRFWKLWWSHISSQTTHLIADPLVVFEANKSIFPDNKSLWNKLEYESFSLSSWLTKLNVQSKIGELYEIWFSRTRYPWELDHGVLWVGNLAAVKYSQLFLHENIRTWWGVISCSLIWNLTKKLLLGGWQWGRHLVNNWGNLVILTTFCPSSFFS